LLVNHLLAGPTIFRKSCSVAITSSNRLSEITGVVASTLLPSVDGGMMIPPG
jgi:hypothetical protein